MDEGGARPARGARIAPEAVWKEVRADYLAGLSARDCCRRHGVGLSALRERAAREGWRRADQPWAPPVPLGDLMDEGRALEEAVQGDLDRVDPADLTWIAYRRMQRALLRGDAAEVVRWHKVHALMSDELEEMRAFVRRERAWAAERDRRRLAAAVRPHGPNGPDSPDSPDPLSRSGADDGGLTGPADPPPPPAPPRQGPAA